MPCIQSGYHESKEKEESFGRRASKVETDPAVQPVRDFPSRRRMLYWCLQVLERGPSLIDAEVDVWARRAKLPCACA